MNEETSMVKVGEVVEGYVVSVILDTIILDVNEEYTGLISIEEYSAEPLENLMLEVEIGDVIKAKVVKMHEDELILSCK